jgi:hypothetical protein
MRVAAMKLSSLLGILLVGTLPSVAQQGGKIHRLDGSTI